MKKIAVFVGLTFLVACSHKMISITQADADKVSQKWPGTTLADLNEGKSLYEANCAKCHGLKNPSSRTEMEWRQIVPPMAHKAKIDSKTEDNILRYLVAMCDKK